MHPPHFVDRDGEPAARVHEHHESAHGASLAAGVIGAAIRIDAKEARQRHVHDEIAADVDDAGRRRAASMWQ